MTPTEDGRTTSDVETQFEYEEEPQVAMVDIEIGLKVSSEQRPRDSEATEGTFDSSCGRSQALIFAGGVAAVLLLGSVIWGGLYALST